VRNAVVILLIAALSSCGRPEKRPPARPVYTPAKTLYDFKLAYHAPDYETYEALFSPERFTLKVQEPPPGFPGEWGRLEEMEATRALFDDAYHVLLEIETAPGLVGMPPAAATEFTTKPLDVRVRVWREPAYCFYARGTVTFGLTRPDVSTPWLVAELTDGTGASYADIVANEQTFLCSWAAIKWHYLRRKREEDARH